MSKQCAFCKHPNRKELETKILNGIMTQAEVADVIGRAAIQVSRHMKHHVPPAILEAAKVEPEVASGLNVIQELLKINTITKVILEEACADKNNELALKAIARAEKQLELQSRLLGQLQEGTNINIIVNPQWVNLRFGIIKSLESFPEAKEAVIKAIKEVELCS